MMQGNRTDIAHLLLTGENWSAHPGQGVFRAVKIEEGHAARRVAQVVHASHGFLPLIAALVHMNGCAHQIQFVRDGALINFIA